MLAVYLIRIANPKVDKFIDWMKTKINLKVLKILTVTVIVLLALDFIVSTLALDAFITRTSVEFNLNVENKEKVMKKYNYLYKENEKLSNIINALWGNKKMIRTLPNVIIKLEDGNEVYAQDLYPDIVPYYYIFPRGTEIRNKMIEERKPSLMNALNQV